MASERIEKLLAMQQKAEAQKRKAEQPLPVSGRTYTHLRCAARSPKAPAGCSMPSTSTGAPLRRLHRLPHDGALR